MIVADAGLQFRRAPAGAADAPRVLASRRHAALSTGRAAAPRLLAWGRKAGDAVVESWSLQEAPDDVPIQAQLGCVRHVSDGRWLHARACVDDRREPGGLAAATERAYRDLFAVLERHPQVQVHKVWNYLADINGAGDDGQRSERYRLFNAGRQAAFVAAGRSAFEGAPAACALGTDEGCLAVELLAGPGPVIAIENPRQVSAYRYPSQYGPRSPSFSRAAVGDDGHWLFVSGTASIVGHASVHDGDVLAQTHETLRNLDAVFAASAKDGGWRGSREALAYTVYLRDAQDLPAVRTVFETWIGAESLAAREALYLRADVCRAELRVEIEAHGGIDA